MGEDEMLFDDWDLWGEEDLLLQSFPWSPYGGELADPMTSMADGCDEGLGDILAMLHLESR